MTLFLTSVIFEKSNFQNSALVWSVRLRVRYGVFKGKTNFYRFTEGTAP